MIVILINNMIFLLINNISGIYRIYSNYHYFEKDSQKHGVSLFFLLFSFFKFQYQLQEKKFIRLKNEKNSSKFMRYYLAEKQQLAYIVDQRIRIPKYTRIQIRCLKRAVTGFLDVDSSFFLFSRLGSGQSQLDFEVIFYTQIGNCCLKTCVFAVNVLKCAELSFDRDTQTIRSRGMST